MKYEILDENIVDELHNQLNKGERIIWEGKPQRSFDFSLSRGDAAVNAWIQRITNLLMIGLFLFPFLISIYLALELEIQPKVFISIFIVIAFIPEILKILQRKKTKYIISNQRIIFKLWKNGGSNIYSIPFSEMKGVVVARETEKDGVIHLAVKNPHRLKFDTFNLSSGERRHHPTLEMIENVEQVASFIRQGIQENDELK